MTRRPAAVEAVTPLAITVLQLKRKVDITPEFILRCNLSTNYFSSTPKQKPYREKSPSNIMMVYTWTSCKFNLLLFRNLDSSLPSFCLQITLSAPEQGLNFKASSQASWVKRDPPHWGAETTRRGKSSLTSFDGRGGRQISTESL